SARYFFASPWALAFAYSRGTPRRIIFGSMSRSMMNPATRASTIEAAMLKGDGVDRGVIGIRQGVHHRGGDAGEQCVEAGGNDRGRIPGTGGGESADEAGHRVAAGGLEHEGGQGRDDDERGV